MDKEIRIDQLDPTKVLIVTPEQVIPEQVTVTSLDKLYAELKGFVSTIDNLTLDVGVKQSELDALQAKITNLTALKDATQQQIDLALGKGAKVEEEVKDVLEPVELPAEEVVG